MIKSFILFFTFFTCNVYLLLAIREYDYKNNVNFTMLGFSRSDAHELVYRKTISMNPDANNCFHFFKNIVDLSKTLKRAQGFCIENYNNDFNKTEDP